MPNPPRRARFQVHLSTAIVLIFAAGGLLCANIRGFTKSVVYISVGEVAESKHTYTEYGWPFHLLPENDYDIAYPNEEKGVELLGHLYSDYAFVILNVPIALGILFLIWYACEWLIRRRALKKGA